MLDYLRLPAEQTHFEKAYLERTTRVALAALWGALPLMVGVAWLSETGPFLALVLSAAVVAGPTFAWLGAMDRRRVSVVVGIAAMGLSGLLVHFGQGPTQLEMHFAFFCVLAALSIFGNPAVVLAAAATVVVHHTVIWWLLPASVLNYDASAYVVAVHAFFVVFEGAAAVYMARAFFDNVIGLERKVEERSQELGSANRSMRTVLDNVDQGLATVDRDGVMSPQRSTRFDEWVGSAGTSSLADSLRRLDPAAGEWFELGWEDLLADLMPLEVNLEQLPRQIQRDEQHLAIDYVPISHDHTEHSFDELLVVVSDVTAERARERAEATQRQSMAFVGQLLDDPDGVQSFLETGSDMVQGLVARSCPDPATLRRWVHTLKGNALSMDLDLLGAELHALEERMQEDDRDPTDAELRALQDHWQSLVDIAEKLAPSDDRRVRIEHHQLDQLIAAVQAGASGPEVVKRLEALRAPSVAPRLKRLGEQARRAAHAVGRPEPRIVFVGADQRLPGLELGAFWSSLVHVMRNAVDHGLEGPEERSAAGKPEAGTLTVGVVEESNGWTVFVEDDGAGIDWDALRAVGERRGLPTATREDLEQILFADGASTRTEASLVSGRGVGMAALRDAVEELGGRIVITSTPGKGTRFAFGLPAVQVRGFAVA